MTYENNSSKDSAFGTENLNSKVNPEPAAARMVLPPIQMLADDEDARPDLSHDQLAIELGIAGFDADALYVKLLGKWYIWNGFLWVVDERHAVMTLTRKFLREKANQLLEWAQDLLEAADSDAEQKAAEKAHRWAEREATRLRNKETVTAVLNLATSNPSSSATPEQFDAKPELLSTPIGSVDLCTGEPRDPKRTDHATKSTAVGPADSGSSPTLWLSFLDRIFKGDAELIAFIQRACGYALTGSVVEHKLLFLYGTGRNGKSVFLNTLMGILHQYARRAPTSLFLKKAHEGHPTEVAGLQGARLVVGSELPAGKIWDEAVIKSLTGGDVLTARFMRQDFFDFLPQFTLMIAGNHQPAIRGVDEAMRARMVLVPFEVTIPEEERDTELESKLQGEWSEILSWCIEGAVEWYKQGLNPPDKVIDASTEYLENEDLIGLFLEERTIEDATERVSNQDLARDFNSWTSTQGIHAWSQTAITKAVKETGRFETYKSGNDRGFVGVKLTQGPRLYPSNDSRLHRKK